MAFTGPADDRLAIRELIDRYNDAIARFDAEAWGATWAEDAEWELMGLAVKGRESIVGLWQKTMQQFDFVVFRAVPGAIEVSGDEATGRVWAHEVVQPKGAELRTMHGRYDDRYAKSGGEWRFRSRRYQVLREY